MGEGGFDLMRAGMADLVDRLRILVGDPLVGDELTSTFTDDDLQAFLDERGANAALALLQPDTTASGLATVYRSPVRWWESDAVLSSGSGPLETVAGSDPASGIWVFAAPPASAVYITGRYFDLYGSAMSVLQAWAARDSGAFDFAADGQSFSRSQKTSARLAVAREYARRAISPGMRTPLGLNWWEV